MTTALRAVMPDGRQFELDPDDAHRLVAALWAVSAQQGAVVAIGKIEHRLTDPTSDRSMDLSDSEAAAIQTALDTAADLTPGLVRFREASSV